MYYAETVSSTMDVSRELARQGSGGGTVIIAGFQEQGRGRQGRPWRMDRDRNLAFTIHLEYPALEAIPEALTLRTGLAVSRAIEAVLPPLAGRVLVKWPNDLLIAGPGGETRGGDRGKARKAAGILTEAEGGRVYIGIGINVAQEDFPPDLRDKAISLYGACGEPRLPPPQEARFLLVEQVLGTLREELGSPGWRERLLPRLYRLGEEVTFLDGPPGSDREVRGVLTDLGPGGELLIRPRGEEAPRAFVTGELRVYPDSLPQFSIE